MSSPYVGKWRKRPRADWKIHYSRDEAGRLSGRGNSPKRPLDWGAKRGGGGGGGGVGKIREGHVRDIIVGTQRWPIILPSLRQSNKFHVNGILFGSVTHSSVPSSSPPDQSFPSLSLSLSLFLSVTLSLHLRFRSLSYFLEE